jgi:hypothetical protein
VFGTHDSILGEAQATILGPRHLNSAILPRLGNLSRLAAMTGLPADHPLASITTSSDVRPQAVNLAETRALRRQAIDSTLSALDSMHKEVAEKASLARQRAMPGSTRKLVPGLATSNWSFRAARRDRDNSL